MYDKQRTTQSKDWTYREDSQMDQGTQWYRQTRRVNECNLISSKLHTGYSRSMIWDSKVKRLGSNKISSGYKWSTSIERYSHSYPSGYINEWNTMWKSTS